MKTLLLATASIFSVGICAAQELGHVISTTPIVQQVGVPRQVCASEQVAVAQAKSGAGAALGAIAGGAMGNAVGNGGGRAAATILGVIGGAIVGDRVEGASPAQMQTVQRCSTQTFLENRTVAYTVVYEFAGRQYSVQMPNDPGPTIQLQVTPVGAGAPVPGASNLGRQATAMQPPELVVTQPVYPVYPYGPQYGVPIGVEIGVGPWGGYHGYHRWR